MIAIWRMNLKPGNLVENITLADVCAFCQREGVIGVGWGGIKKTTDVAELKQSAATKYPGSGAYKALNAMQQMEVGDLIWTRHDGKYFLCRVTKKWIDGITTDEHKDHDVPNFVSVQWSAPLTEENVPGKVVNSFIPSASVQRVRDVNDISKILWNSFSDGFKYPDISKNPNSFWASISSEQLECLVLLYLQKKGYLIYSSSHNKSTPKYECVMTEKDGKHKCFVQVKRNEPLDKNKYLDFVSNGKDKVYLFTTSEDYIKIDKANSTGAENICEISKKDLVDFIEDKKNLGIIPDIILKWYLLNK